MRDNKILMITSSRFNVDSFARNTVLTSLLILLVCAAQEMPLRMAEPCESTYTYLCSRATHVAEQAVGSWFGQGY